MSQQNEREYLEYRQRVCAEKARTAKDPGIGLIHQQFADHYMRRLENSGQIGLVR